MKEFKEARENYEAIPIPEELDQRVRAGIRQGRKNRRSRYVRRTLGTAAACFAVVFGALNLSPAVAAAAADVPVLGGLFQVLTVRDFTDADSDRTVEVEQPAVTGSDYADAVSARIQEKVDEKIAEGEQIIADYKEAYFATGGTEEDWAKHDNKVTVTYDIKSQTDTTVSFVVSSAVSIASAYQEQTYYNLDLAAGRELTLQDLLGADWVKICNDAIRAQMAAAEDPTVYFDESAGGFATVDETTSFYINESGNPVVVFPPYTVAIGAMGSVEFEIV